MTTRPVQADAAATPPVRAELLTVEHVFADAATSYVVPVYQRNYAWRAEQIEQLVDDIWTAARDADTERYFLGNLVVAQRTTTETEGRHLEVVDGQQRLTTLALLLRALPEGYVPRPFSVRDL